MKNEQVSALSLYMRREAVNLSDQPIEALLGGRLSLGHRMNGEDAQQVKRNVQDSLDRVLRRMRRVAEMLESELSS